ncbi:MAG: threonylcarbamoyl-AMP synthase [Phycisphaerae bacterium]|nr:threonylcarbamoyl-AMP synthase [Phycisphaerae bacterium]
MSIRVITVNASAKDSGDGGKLSAAKEAADAISKGALVGFGTETVYGVGALATNREAMRTLRNLKSRPAAPFSVLVTGIDDVRRYVQKIPLRASWVMSKTWPGAVTLLLETGGKFPDKKLQQTKGLYEALTMDGVIGLRCPDEPVVTAMLEKIDGPVVAPSANLAGQPSPRTAADVLEGLGSKIDLLLDCGPTKYGKDSTIMRFAGNTWDIVRPGVYDTRTMGKFMKRKIIFVCTGNTCRSPMAAGIAKKLIAETLDLRVEDLHKNGVDILSGGVYAADGSTATPEAVLAAEKFGVNISHHKSRNLTPEMVKSADVVLCMTGFHAGQVRALAGNSAGKISMLDEREEIPDPIGGDVGVYLRTAEHMQEALQLRIARGAI